MPEHWHHLLLRSLLVVPRLLCALRAYWTALPLCLALCRGAYAGLHASSCRSLHASRNIGFSVYYSPCKDCRSLICSVASGHHILDLLSVLRCGSGIAHSTHASAAGMHLLHTSPCTRYTVHMLHRAHVTSHSQHASVAMWLLHNTWQLTVHMCCRQHRQHCTLSSCISCTTLGSSMYTCAADNVGDNVGDIAGMGADLFGSFAEATCAALVISSVSTLGTEHVYVAMCYPLLISAVGILVCLLTTLIATDLKPARGIHEIESTLKMQLVISTVLATPVSLLHALIQPPSM